MPNKRPSVKNEKQYEGLKKRGKDDANEDLRALLDQLRAGADAGLKMFTHLGNGCPMNVHRHDNIVQRGLAMAERLWIGFIADGVHVPFFALRNYLTVIAYAEVIGEVLRAERPSKK